MKKICVIDGSSFLYRAFYALRPLNAPDGRQIQAVFGFLKMLKKILNDITPDGLIVAWDSKGKTARHEIFTEYKATRQAPPFELIEQKKIIVDILNDMGCVQLAKVGEEADDLIASVVEKFKDKLEVVIVSTDKDLAQLLTDNVYIYDPFKNELYNKFGFEEKRGFPVERLPLYHSLLGDTSDNIPGVKGVGKKTAEDLVKLFSSLDDIYQNIEKISSSRVQKLLVESKDNAYISYQLFLLRTEDLSLNLADLKFNSNNWKKGYDMFLQLGFKTLIPTSYSPIVENSLPLVNEKDYLFKEIISENDLNSLLDEIVTKGHFAIDTETTGIDTLNSDIVGMSICCSEKFAYYIPLDQHQQIDIKTLKTKLNKVFQDCRIAKYMHNAKFDLLVLDKAGFHINGLAADTMIGANLLRVSQEKRGLKDLSERYLGERMQSFKELMQQCETKNFSQVPLKNAVSYAAADALQTFRLVEILHSKLKEADLWDIYVNIELPLVEVLFSMEKAGILLNKDKILNTAEKINKEITDVLAEFKDLSGVDDNFNINSSQQVAKLLFEDIGLKPIGKTQKGTGYSTNEEVLVKLSLVHPIPALILKYRELYKLKSTYIEGLQKVLSEKNSIHTTYNQIAVATGRLSSQDPNLQNIPGAFTEYGKDIRSSFEASSGFKFISADYSQIELRVLAYLSRDPSLMEAFVEGRDIHTETASRLFDIKAEKVTAGQRQVGKKINFSVLYGLTPYGLSKDLNISVKDAAQYIDAYFNQFPGVRTWMDKIVEEALEKGYVTTEYGRKRFFPEIHEKNKNIFEAAKRAAINTVAQGTAAEIVKIGMINLQKMISRKDLEAKLILQIHDELVIESPEEKTLLNIETIRKQLESVVSWPIPLEVSVRHGKTWADISK